MAFRKISISVAFMALCCVLAAQPRSTNDSSISLPQKCIAQINNKVDKYYNRITAKTEKTLIKLSRWENKIQRLLQKVNPAAAERLFANKALTFNGMLEKYREGSVVIQQYTKQYDEYRDKLNASIAYVASSQAQVDEDEILAAKQTETKLDQLEGRVESTEAVQNFIKERKKILIEQTIQYIGKSKYLQKINKESFYYVETLRNYKEIFSDAKKAESVALEILNKTPAFQDFFAKNSQLAALFGLPGGGSGVSVASPNFTGLQTRAGVTAIMQQQIAAGGPNAQQMMAQNIQAAQGELNVLKNRVLNSGGGGNNTGDAALPDFKPDMTKTQSLKQRLQWGSNLQFGRPSRLIGSQADLGLNLGYKVNAKSIVGIGLSCKVNYGRFGNFYLQYGGVGLRSFVDYQIKKSFFISGGYEMNYNNAFSSIGSLQQYDLWQRSGLIGVGKKINIKTKWLKGTQFQLLYDFLYRQQQLTGQPLIFRVGYNF